MARPVVFNVWAISANATSAPASSIQSANTAAQDVTRSGVLPDTTNDVTTGSARTGAAGIRALLDHHMRIRATEAERRHPRPPRTPHRRPVLLICNYFQSHLVEGDVWIRGLEVQVRRNVAALHRQHRLDETRDPGRRLQMTQIRLDGADQQR